MRSGNPFAILVIIFLLSAIFLSNFAAADRVIIELQGNQLAGKVTAVSHGSMKLPPSGNRSLRLHQLARGQDDAIKELSRIAPLRRIKRFNNTLNAIAVDISHDKLAELKELPFIKSVHPDKIVHALREVSVPAIHADEVWSLLDSQGYNITGRNITVAVIDSGINYSHPDLGGCSYNQFITRNCAKVIGGYDFVNGDDDPMDDDWHGTHVAGIVAGDGSVKGVAPGALLVAYKVLDENGSGYESDIIAAIERAVDPNSDGNTSDHYDILTLSLGGAGTADDPMSLALDSAVKAGAVVVVAAGNSGPGGDNNCNNYPNKSSFSICSPATSRLAIAVGAGGRDGTGLLSYSSRGPLLSGGVKPDVISPGSNINSTYKVGYLVTSGTSMAAPHVAGIAALVLQKHPEWTPEEIKMVIRDSSVDQGFAFTDGGWGRADALAAVGYPLAPPVAFLNYTDMHVSSSFNLYGTSSSANFTNYSIYYGEGMDPSSWSLLNTTSTPVEYGKLAFVNISLLHTENYTMRLIVQDSNNYTSEDRIIISAIDSVQPDFINIVTSQQQECNFPYVHDFNATDNFLVDSFWINSSDYSINKTTGIMHNITVIGMGNYSSILLFVNDSSNNTRSAVVNIDVIDSISPKFMMNESSVLYDSNTNLNYTVNASDLCSVVYYSINDTDEFQIDASGSITNITNLSTSGYDILVMINDSSGNTNSTVISLIFNDNQSPTFTELPVDQYVEFGSSLYYDINATDNIAIASYSVNDSNFSIGPSGILRNASFLSVGVYSLNITVNDTSKNINSSVIEINVSDTTDPVFISVQNITWPAGVSLGVQLYADDLSGIDSWRVNDSLNFSFNSSGYLVNISPLSLGLHWLNITINDSFSNFASELIYVNITSVPDNDSPVFYPALSKYTFLYGRPLIYDANATDASGVITYAINDTTDFEIDNVTGIITNRTPLSVHSYDLQVNATDAFNNTNSSSIYFYISDPVPPKIQLISPANATTWSSSSTVAFRFNVTENFSVSNCTLRVASKNITDDTITKNILQQISYKLSNSDYIWSIECYDDEGNPSSSGNRSLRVNYVPPEESSHSSGGGGGGGGAALPISTISKDEKSTTYYRVEKNRWVNWSLDFSGIVGVSILPSQDGSNVKISVEKIKEIPVAAVRDSIGYLKISSTINVSSARIRFKVNRSITDSWDIVLSRYTDRWVDLPVFLIGEDANYSYFESVTPGFSYFSIRKIRRVIVEAKQDEKNITPNVTEEITLIVNNSEPKNETEVVIEKNNINLDGLIYVPLLVFIALITMLPEFYKKKRVSNKHEDKGDRKK